MFSSIPCIVLSSENGYNAEFRKLTTIYCDFCPCETTTYGGVLPLEIVLLPQSEKIPGFRTGDEACYAWFSSVCTNMGWWFCTASKNVHLPQKQVLDEMAYKQKAVPKEVVLASFRTAFGVVFIISELKNVVNL